MRGKSPGPTAASGGGAASASSSASGSGRPNALAFSGCMRSNGVSGFPDPQPGGRFAFPVNASPRSSRRKQSARSFCPTAASRRRSPNRRWCNCKGSRPACASTASPTSRTPRGLLKATGSRSSRGVGWPIRTIWIGGMTRREFTSAAPQPFRSLDRHRSTMSLLSRADRSSSGPEDGVSVQAASDGQRRTAPNASGRTAGTATCSRQERSGRHRSVATDRALHPQRMMTVAARTRTIARAC